MQEQLVVNILVGTTAVGKTSLALQLAQKHSLSIISADSRQIYQLMDIGTGKIPSKTDTLQTHKYQGFWQIGDTSIYGYDLVTPKQYFSAYDYLKWFGTTVVQLKKQNKRFIVVGGTGFYIDLITGKKTVSNTEPNFVLRKALSEKSLEELTQMLIEKAPDVAKSTDLKNKLRVVRQLELLEHPRKEGLPLAPGFATRLIGLTSTRDVLYGNVDAWAEYIWERGIIAETDNLLRLGYGETLPMKGLIYKTATAFIKNELTRSEALQRIKYDLHAYTRRQQTWFKKNTDIVWLNTQEQNLQRKAEDLLE